VYLSDSSILCRRTRTCQLNYREAVTLSVNGKISHPASCVTVGSWVFSSVFATMVPRIDTVLTSGL
jgi:hypothetical protein